MRTLGFLLAAAAATLSIWVPHTPFAAAQGVWGPACSFEQLTCQNRGGFNTSRCSQYIQDCSIDPDNSTNWEEVNRCTCAPGFLGTDCSIVSPDTPSGVPCPAPLHFDGSMVNVHFGPQPKHIECFADFNSTSGTISLRDHRINVTAQIDASGQGNVSFVLLSHHRNSSDNNPSSEYRCYPIDDDLTCTLSKCVAQGSSYDCSEVSCTSCGAPDRIAAGSVCSPVMYFLTLGIKPPVSLSFQNANPNE